MSFDYCFAYEDRSRIHTSRWYLDGVTTNGNTKGGRLWLTAAADAGVVTVELYRNEGCEAGDLVAGGTADISGIASESVQCELAEANASGLTGEFYFENYLADPQAPVEVLVSLCSDADLSMEASGLSDLPTYDAVLGFAPYCALATRKVLLLVSQRYAGHLGGYGAPEHRHRPGAARETPDFRRLANPDQLKDAAVHWALTLAYGACHERAEETLYSQLRDYHDAKRKEAIAGWNLTFNTNPDGDEDADTQKSSGIVSVTRV